MLLAVAIVALIAIGMAFGFTLKDRQRLLGFTYFSTVASGDDLAMAAMNTAITAWIFDLIAMVTIVIGSFFRFNEKI